MQDKPFKEWADGGALIERIYREELLRSAAPDGSGFANWLCHLLQEGRSEDEIRQFFRESEEYANVHKPLQRIYIEETHFLSYDGQRWIWKGATDFLLFQRYLNGQDITPILTQRRKAGANLVRVLGMAHNISHFYPQDYDGYYEKLNLFVQLCNRYGLYVEFVVYADEQHVKAGKLHFASCIDALDGSLAFGELVNEYPKNGIDPAQFFKPLTGMPWSQGSALADAPPPEPGWDYHTWHGRRDWPKVTSSTEDMWYVSQHIPPKPIVHDEPIGFDEVDIPGKRSTDDRLASQLAVTSCLLGSGATYHSTAGIQSELWGPIQERCAKAFYGAMK